MKRFTESKRNSLNLTQRAYSDPEMMITNSPGAAPSSTHPEKSGSPIKSMSDDGFPRYHRRDLDMMCSQRERERIDLLQNQPGLSLK